jgi:hypothetical protein
MLNRYNGVFLSKIDVHLPKLSSVECGKTVQRASNSRILVISLVCQGLFGVERSGILFQLINGGTVWFKEFHYI